MLAVIIPTLGTLDILGQNFGHIIHYLPDGTDVVLSINPADKEEAKRTLELCDLYRKALLAKHNKRVKLHAVWSDEPVGFANAVNKGYGFVRDELGFNDIEYVMILNDDVVPQSDFAQRLIEELEVSTFRGSFCSNPFVEEISIISPCSKDAFGAAGHLHDQICSNLNVEKGSQLTAAQHNIVWQNSRQLPLRTSNIFGFCLLFSSESIQALCDSEYSYGGIFDNNAYPFGGFDDNDLIVRAFEKGMNCCVSSKVSLDHLRSQTLFKKMGDKSKGLQHCANYLLKWEEQTQAPQKVVAAYRVAFRTINELHVFTTSLKRTASLLDGAVILLTNNPSFLDEGPDGHLFNMFDENFKNYINSVDEDVEGKTQEYFEAITNTINENFDLKVHYWDKEEFNERDERNFSHKIAEDMGADWIMSIDSDEILEKRITRQYINKCTNHPDPQKTTFRASFLNHYESQNLIRLDPPFCNGLASNQGGPRLFKVRKASPVRMVMGSPIGLHCGNTPDYGVVSVSGLRFNHYSHYQAFDRKYKANWYNGIDKQKDVNLIGNNNYNHIDRKDNVQVAMYDGKSGIGFFMLTYEGEHYANIFRHLTAQYSVVDHMALVWTGEWSEEDMEIMAKPHEEWPDKENWMKTGPCWDTAHIARLFKAKWLYQPYDGKNLAECRNAAISYFRQLKTIDNSLGWVLYSDPDEMPYDPVAILRMAETNHTGFCFKFRNMLVSKEKKLTSSFSETIRMFSIKNDDEEIWFTGNVHENLESSLQELQQQNKFRGVPYYPHTTINQGLAGGTEAMAKKLTRYTLALQAQLQENPLDGGSWMALGMQFLNDGETEKAKKCLENSCLCNLDAYLPFKELSLLHLNEARKSMLLALRNCHQTHGHYEQMLKIVQFLQEVSPQPLVIDTGDISVSDIIEELPEFPIEKLEERDGVQIQHDI